MGTDQFHFTFTCNWPSIEGRYWDKYSNTAYICTQPSDHMKESSAVTYADIDLPSS